MIISIQSMSKAEELKKLKQEMVDDTTLPLREGATQLVFGEGNPDTKIYFIGEAPGFYEDRDGRPFIGQAGKLLASLLETIGLSREDVYISNIVRFRPPENRDPTDEEILAFQKYVDREIAIIDPPIVVTLGRFSMNKFLPGTKISQIHGRPRSVSWDGKEIIVLPMYHPAAALRAGEVMNQLKADFLLIKKELESLDKKKEEDKVEEKSAEEKKKDEQLSLL